LHVLVPMQNDTLQNEATIRLVRPGEFGEDTHAEVLDRFEVIEECHEFMLAYAAQGLSSDQGSESGRQVREFLNRAVEALGGLAQLCATAMVVESFEAELRLAAFLAVLDRDARDSLAAIEPVLALPSISSQLIDNLNASMHLRALLTDVFLLGDVLRAQREAAQLVTS
jgi:hypothetical protein